MVQDDILQKPVVAIVILSWNGKKFLEQFMPSVLASEYSPLEIYVADNASTDDTIQFMEKMYPLVHLIRIPKNEGFAKGYNIALKQIVADYFILLNQDVEVTRNWIKPVIQLMQRDETIAACQPKLLSYNEKNKFEHAGAAGGYIDRFGYAFCRGRIFDDTETDEGQYDSTEEIFWASGAALFIKGDLFKRFKGFDPDFFAHMEEIDLCWRLKRAGYKIMYVPESVVYHVGGGSLSKDNPYKTYLNFRNNLFMLFKNLELPDLIWKFPVRIILENVAFVKALLQRKWKEAFAIFRADWHFFISFPFQLKKRIDNYSKYQKFRLYPSRVKQKGYYKKSIIWKYFIQKKKTFRDL